MLNPKTTDQNDSSDDEPVCHVTYNDSSSDDGSTLSPKELEKMKLQEQEKMFRALNTRTDNTAEAAGSVQPARKPAAFAKRKAMSIGSKAGKAFSILNNFSSFLKCFFS